MKKHTNTGTVAKPLYTSTLSKPAMPATTSPTNEHIIFQLQQLAKQIERKYPKGYQGL